MPPPLVLGCWWVQVASSCIQRPTTLAYTNYSPPMKIFVLHCTQQSVVVHRSSLQLEGCIRTGFSHPPTTINMGGSPVEPNTAHYILYTYQDNARNTQSNLEHVLNVEETSRLDSRSPFLEPNLICTAPKYVEISFVQKKSRIRETPNLSTH